MSKEVVFTIPTNEEPYRTYYAERNGGVSLALARIMGVGYLGLRPEFEAGEFYFVPSKTIDFTEARLMGIESERDFYGLAIGNKKYVDKQILHPGLQDGSNLESRFCEEVEKLVLPGYRTNGISLREVTQALLTKHGQVRLKSLGVSDGRGQMVISDQKQIAEIEIQPGEEVVLEADILNKKTISVGKVILASQEYAFIAHQTNDIDPSDLRDRYTGADPVRVIVGQMSDLKKLRLTEAEVLAMEKCIEFDHLYTKTFGVVASRLSYDVLLGQDACGKQLAGITDITGRLGGTCPALVLAIEKLVRQQNFTEVKSRVVLDYAPKDYDDNEVFFINHPTLSIKAKVYEE